MTRAEAIAYMTYARGVHQGWIDYYARCPAGPSCLTCRDYARVAGDTAHHAGIVERYTGVIAVLETAPA